MKPEQSAAWMADKARIKKLTSQRDQAVRKLRKAKEANKHLIQWAEGESVRLGGTRIDSFLEKHQAEGKRGFSFIEDEREPRNPWWKRFLPW